VYARCAGCEKARCVGSENVCGGVNVHKGGRYVVIVPGVQGVRICVL